MEFKSACRVVVLASLVFLASGVNASAQPIEVATDIHSLNSGLCAGVSGSPLVDGAAAVQSDCAGAAFQTFSLRPFGGQVQIIVQISHQCLSVTQGSSTQGAPIIQTSC